MTDYYAALGVPPEADVSAIKERYRELAKQYHPDIAADKAAAEKRMREINEAWEVLGDAERRADYDAKRAQAGFGAGSRKVKNGGAPFGEVDYKDLMGKFDAFFGKAAAPPAGREKQRNPLNADGLFDKFMGIKRK
jgi:DnaJ-class molecular chaperone